MLNYFYLANLPFLFTSLPQIPSYTSFFIISHSPKRVKTKVAIKGIQPCPFHTPTVFRPAFWHGLTVLYGTPGPLRPWPKVQFSSFFLVWVSLGTLFPWHLHHKESRNVLFLSFGEPSTDFPTPPTPEALTINFCQVFFEPSFTPPNHAFQVCKKVVPSMFKKSLTLHIQISKGQEGRTSKFKEDLFAWLILFQPDLKRKGGY